MFKKAFFDIRAKENPTPRRSRNYKELLDCRKTVQGYAAKVSGVLVGIHKTSANAWTLTHIPSGFALYVGTSKRDCEQQAAAMVEKLRTLQPGQLAKLVKEFEAIEFCMSEWHEGIKPARYSAHELFSARKTRKAIKQAKASIEVEALAPVEIEASAPVEVVEETAAQVERPARRVAFLSEARNPRIFVSRSGSTYCSYSSKYAA